MSLPNLHYPHAIEFTGVGISPAIPQIALIESKSIDRNYAIEKKGASSDFGPCNVRVSGLRPEASFTTTSMKTILDAVNVSGSAGIVRDVSAGNVNFWYRAGKQHGFREDLLTAVHIRGSVIQNGLLFFESFTANASGSTISSKILTSNIDDVTDSIQIDITVASPPAITCDDTWVLGRVELNGAVVDGVTSVTWSNNIQEESRVHAGEKRPGYVGVRDASPVVTIETEDARIFSTGGEYGIAITNLEIWLKKTSKASIHVPVATAEHIKISHDAGLAVAGTLSGSPATTGLACHLEKNNDKFLTIDTLSVIA